MATLYGYCLFHLNIAFSSIEADDRKTIVEKCYWPLLNLANKHKWPMAIEATGYTLEEIARIDPNWITTLRDLIDEGIIEFVGAGYAQLIGPLVPAEVVEHNLSIGNETYQRLLGIKPTLALVNEQAYSRGLIEHYQQAGYSAIIMDWDNCAARHPEWSPYWRYAAQEAKGTKATLPVLWTNTIAFQKFQRLAHGDISTDEYCTYIESQVGEEDRVLPVYGNDVEIFDYRPGRFQTEAAPSQESEWNRIEHALKKVVDDTTIKLIKPSDALAIKACKAPAPLSLETADYPIPVKKQHKYNITRWSVSGRDDVYANTKCWQLYQAMAQSKDATQDDWRQLCYLWASDFRTHITEKRWAAYNGELDQLSQKFSSPKVKVFSPNKKVPAPVVTETETLLTIKTKCLELILNKRRGLAVQAFTIVNKKEQRTLCGTLPHGFFDHIGYGFDWYSGGVTLESPGAPKVTDLNPAQANWSIDPETNCLIVQTKIDTPKGLITKSLTIHPDTPRVDYDILLDWQDAHRGSLRMGNFTLNPDAFDIQQLTYRSHNGGVDPETFALAGIDVDHGAPVTFLVSASCGLGMTEGWVDLGDDKWRLRIDVDMTKAALLGLITHKPVVDNVFCRVSLSALEMDETRNPIETTQGPRQFSFSLSATPV